MDMTGTAAGRIIAEALRNEHPPQEAKDTLQGVADLEQSRRHAVLHLLMLASTLGANLKLLRKKGVLASKDHQQHLTQAAYQLPFEQSRSRLFRDGILELNKEYISKGHTRQLDQAVLKQLSVKGARLKQSQLHGQQSK